MPSQRKDNDWINFQTFHLSHRYKCIEIRMIEKLLVGPTDQALARYCWGALRATLEKAVKITRFNRSESTIRGRLTHIRLSSWRYSFSILLSIVFRSSLNKYTRWRGCPINSATLWNTRQYDFNPGCWPALSPINIKSNRSTCGNNPKKINNCYNN